MKKYLIATILAMFSTVAYPVDGAIPTTGAFHGYGRQCYGTLFIRTKTLEWHTPFANCNKTRYTIAERLKKVSSETVVFLTHGNGHCPFGVIVLSHDWGNEYPGWYATGYRSLQDYRQKSSDTLNCKLEHMNQ